MSDLAGAKQGRPFSGGTECGAGLVQMILQIQVTDTILAGVASESRQGRRSGQGVSIGLVIQLRAEPPWVHALELV